MALFTSAHILVPWFFLDKTEFIAHSLQSHFSRAQFFAILWTIAHQAPLSLGFSSKNTGVGFHSLLQGIFPTQGSNSGLLHPKRLETSWRTERGP